MTTSSTTNDDDALIQDKTRQVILSGVDSRRNPGLNGVNRLHEEEEEGTQESVMILWQPHETVILFLL